MQKFIVYLLLLAAGAAGAASDPDLSFGSSGVMRYGFDAVGGGRNDRAGVACPGPRGSLFAVGTASSDRRVVSVWLAENGALDPSFSDDGKQSFDLPAAWPKLYGETGLCGSDGKVTFAFESVDANDEGRLTLLRINPADGLPDPSFGTAGRVDVDLDAYATGIGEIESIVAVNPGRDGDLIVTGWYDRPGDASSGFVVRITATGGVAAVAFAEAFDATSHQFVAAMPSPDGALWVAGTTDGAPRGGRVYRLDYATLAWLGTAATLPAGFEPRSGRALDAGAFALAGRIDEAVPAVALLTASGASALALPPVPSAHLVVDAQIVPLSNGTYAVAADVVNASNLRFGFYFAGVRRAGGAFALETTFGEDGSRLVPAGFGTGCGFAAFDLGRVTVWRDRPVWFGTAQVCDTISQHDDYLFLRLTRSDLIFRDGFQ